MSQNVAAHEAIPLPGPGWKAIKPEPSATRGTPAEQAAFAQGFAAAEEAGREAVTAADRRAAKGLAVGFLAGAATILAFAFANTPSF